MNNIVKMERDQSEFIKDKLIQMLYWLCKDDYPFARKQVYDIRDYVGYAHILIAPINILIEALDKIQVITATYLGEDKDKTTITVGACTIAVYVGVIEATTKLIKDLI